MDIQSILLQKTGLQLKTKNNHITSLFILLGKYHIHKAKFAKTLPQNEYRIEYKAFIVIVQ